MKKFSFGHVINNCDNSSVIVGIKFEAEEGINYSELERFAKKVFSAKDNYKSLEQLITFIRTIFKGVKETELNVSIFDKWGNLKERVIYYNITEMEYSLRQVKVGDKELCLELQKGRFSIFDLQGNDLQLSDYSVNNEFEKFITNQLNRIYYLGRLKPIELDKMAEKSIVTFLCMAYKEFFEEVPDFTKKGMSDIMNNMMSILTSLSICYMPDVDYLFKYDSIDKVPRSDNLELLVTKLIPLGKIDNIDYSLLKSCCFYESGIEMIKGVGKLIREEVVKLNLKVEDILKYLASYFHTRNWVSRTPTSKLLKESSCVPSEYYDIMRQLSSQSNQIIKDCYTRVRK